MYLVEWVLLDGESIKDRSCSQLQLVYLVIFGIERIVAERIHNANPGVFPWQVHKTDRFEALFKFLLPGIQFTKM